MPDPTRWLPLVPAAMLLVAPLPWPYGYYQLLRVVVCAATAFTAFQEYSRAGKVSGWVQGLIALGILFNPVLPVTLPRAAWAAFNVAGAVFLAVFVFRRPSAIGG